MVIERENSRLKWNSRVNRMQIFRGALSSYQIPNKKYLPQEFSILLRKFTAWCSKCNNPFYPDHLEFHGVKGIRIDEMFKDLDEIKKSLDPRSKNKREEIMNCYSFYFKEIISKVDKVLKEFAEDF
jgi:hypothetical protein